MSVLKSFELNGKKLSFANWVSMQSPEDTPFLSMTRKDTTNQTRFQWQVGHLSPVRKGNAAVVLEGSEAGEGDFIPTSIKSNYTQIMRKVVKVSLTANSTKAYGRQSELEYQITKAVAELKRDVELALLNNTTGHQEFNGKPRITTGFSSLVAPREARDGDTGAEVHFYTQVQDTVDEKDFDDMARNLWTAGSKANTIMFHPDWCEDISAIQGGYGRRVPMFDNHGIVTDSVGTWVDKYGREYRLVPNRWMPNDKIYFFNPNDFTQVMLREPSRQKLSSDGSYERWMVEIEVGLRLTNPYAAGVLDTKKTGDGAQYNLGWSKATFNYTQDLGNDLHIATAANISQYSTYTMNVKPGTKASFVVQTLHDIPDGTTNDSNYRGAPYNPVSTDYLVLLKGGEEITRVYGNGYVNSVEILVTPNATPEITGGLWHVEYRSKDDKVRASTATVRTLVTH